MTADPLSGMAWRERLAASRESQPDPLALAWLEAGVSHGWTADPIPLDPYARAFKTGQTEHPLPHKGPMPVRVPKRRLSTVDRRGVLQTERIAAASVMTPDEARRAMRDAGRVGSYDASAPPSERVRAVARAQWTPPSPEIPVLEHERRSPGGSDSDLRPVLTQAASENLAKRNADSAKLRTSYRPRGRFGGKRFYDRISTAGLWPIERHPDGAPVLVPNTWLRVVHDIDDRQACIRRRSDVRPALVMLDAMQNDALTQAQVRNAFKRGLNRERVALRHRVRATLVAVHGAGVSVSGAARFFGLQRQRIYDMGIIHDPD